MLSRAISHKGLKVPIHQVRFLDTRTGKIYVESVPDADLEKRLKSTAKALVNAWDKVA
jgi:hypothetical protein